MKRIIILGCSGSIGTTALQAIRSRQLPLKVVGLSSHTNSGALISLGMEFGVEAICLTSSKLQDVDGIRTYSLSSGLKQMLASLDADIVLNAIAGFQGLEASLAVLQSGFDLALANKESVVCAGSYLFDVAKHMKRSIIPVDSEHSALSALLEGRDRATLDSLIITASGGPFRTLEASRFSEITVEQALAHPTWNMGRKITIDSATLANKALEVIEASHLFGFDAEHIEVVIHPQSIVHSMVRTIDGAVYAQLGTPDMTLPIINALQPGFASLVRPLDFSSLTLQFEKPDFTRFPLLQLAFSILKRGGSSALAFNAADEVAVEAFLSHRISYVRMIEIVQRVLDGDWTAQITGFSRIIELDHQARVLARSML
ncbi:MAG: 1-deoxy-D-xylulose-5-phosphate reductoisomerase [Sphaerochaeta sp.]|jgi:1-deoxy-D-xylulose-5-phosphate reductoisomerase|uniref:1-deoxy-D-xylulose-5-phosphate reductoisomerase n=1 Tax=Sphaerochaeta sp. TaxID=1972642 RepID=UPI002FC61F97